MNRLDAINPSNAIDAIGPIDVATLKAAEKIQAEVASRGRHVGFDHALRLALSRKQLRLGAPVTPDPEAARRRVKRRTERKRERQARKRGRKEARG